MIIHSNLSKMKNEILPTCLQGNCRDNFGEFSRTSYGLRGLNIHVQSSLLAWLQKLSFNLCLVLHRFIWIKKKFSDD